MLSSVLRITPFLHVVTGVWRTCDVGDRGVGFGGRASERTSGYLALDDKTEELCVLLSVGQQCCKDFCARQNMSMAAL